MQNEYVEAMELKDLELMESIEEVRKWLSEEIAKLEGAKKGLRRDFEGLQEERKGRYHDEFDTLGLEELRLMREVLTQDSRAIVGNSSHNSIWTEGAPREASKYKRLAAADVERGIALINAASFLIRGVPIGIAAFLATAGIKESVQELTRRTESCGSPLGLLLAIKSRSRINEVLTAGLPTTTNPHQHARKNHVWAARPHLTLSRRTPVNRIMNQASAITCCESMVAQSLQMTKSFKTFQEALKGVVL